MKVIMSTDGSTYPRNPGSISAGVCMVDETQKVIYYRTHKNLMAGTNSEAEYLALITGLNSAIGMDVREIHCITDSQFMYNQIIGANQVRAGHLKKHKDRVLTLVKKFDRFSIEWKSRESDMGVLADAASKWVYAPVVGKEVSWAKKLVLQESRKKELLRKRSHSQQAVVNR